jgi:DNA-binding transcriptional regulator YiaG
LLADPTYPGNPKTFGQELRKKRMDLGLQIKDLARLVNVTSDTIITWELRNVKPGKRNSRRVKKFLELQGAKR